MKIRIVAKCSDCFGMKVLETELEYNGEVPRNIGIGGGDYVRLTIDNDTGKIEGWKPLTQEQLEEVAERT